VFYVCAAVTFFGGVFYVVFCDADLQKWAASGAGEEDEETNETKKENLYTVDTRF
jgi:hypothetical protein